MSHGLQARPGAVLAALSCLLALAFMGGIAAGSYRISPADFLDLVLSALGGVAHQVPAQAEAVLWQVRLPRVACAALVGGALAMSGAGMQAVFRNPLAAPDLLGVSAGAALGAVAGMYLGWPLAAVQAAAFLGGLAAVALVWLASAWLGAADRTLTLILGGVAIGSLLSAGVALLKYLADPYGQLPAMTFWLMGSFAGVGPSDALVLLATTSAATGLLAVLRWRVDLLLLGDDEARTSGVRPGWLRAAVVVACTLAASGAVAVAGVIGWIGLVVPHAARLLVGSAFARLLPASMLCGAALLLVVDTIARGVPDAELPPGVLMALVGAPVLFVLLALRADR
ncbi:MAG TPA: iron ABC transporter permease [Quisquiliibacterium sp.]|nr:iron ABC transporter permease [Quisquiliibacterium sp.]